jgi:2-polyprenyl-6-methoxyphenol hydroxylase-like FAD-dependent oxidoreductase
MYDVLIVGARVAGASTALLLARKGFDVLVVDRAAFPSDTLSTHQVQVPGVARLARWGLLERLIASNAPATRRLRFDPGPAVLSGRLPEYAGADAMFSPRRTVLDALLVDAAREAGAEIRERFVVDEVLTAGACVTGIRGRERRGSNVAIRAPLVIGADGKNSFVASTVQAPSYHEKPCLTTAYYTYWEGLPVEGGEVYVRPGRAIGVWPTNDGLVLTVVFCPNREFRAFRSDVERNFLAALDLAGDLGERVGAATRAERFYGTADLPNFFRRPFGPGWALLGDAGHVLDPITGRGIDDAFRDAEVLADAVEAGLGGREPLESALARYQAERDRAALPMYEFTAELASLGPPVVEQQVLFRALEGNEAEIERFFGVFAGTVPLGDYFTPKNLGRIVGRRGMARILLSKARPGRRSATEAAAAAA